MCERTDWFERLEASSVQRGRQQHPTLVVALSPSDGGAPWPLGVDRLDAAPGSVAGSVHELGLTKAQWAALAGVTPSAISQAESTA